MSKPTRKPRLEETPYHVQSVLCGHQGLTVLSKGESLVGKKTRGLQYGGEGDQHTQTTPPAEASDARCLQGWPNRGQIWPGARRNMHVPRTQSNQVLHSECQVPIPNTTLPFPHLQCAWATENAWVQKGGAGFGRRRIHHPVDAPLRTSNLQKRHRCSGQSRIAQGGPPNLHPWEVTISRFSTPVVRLGTRAGPAM